MKKKVLIISSLLTLTSCNQSTSEISSYLSNSELSQIIESNNSSIVEESSVSQESQTSIEESSSIISSSESTSEVESSSSVESLSTEESSSIIEEEIKFTKSEQKIMNETAGIIVPYVEADEYEVEEYEEYSYIGYSYISYGLSSREYKAYLKILENTFGKPTSYKSDDTTVYCYHSNDVCFEVYYDNSDYYETETAVYALKKVEVNTSYIEFNKSDFATLGNITLPFYACSYYDLYEYSYYYVDIICYDIYGVDIDDLNAYLKILKNSLGSYSYDKEYDCYVFNYGNYEYDVFLDSYITDCIEYEYIGVQIYGNYEEDPDDPDDPDNPQEETETINNKNKGLPTGTNGIYNVDFTKATYFESLSDYAPTTGKTKVLVVPVEYPDMLASTKGYEIEDIKTAFEKSNEESDVISLYDYYYTSSNGMLDLDIDVLDTWYKTKKKSSYYYDYTYKEDGYTYYMGEDVIMDEVLQYLDSQGYDLSEYDSNDDGMIDAICMISTFDVEENPKNSDNLFGWAYSTQNYYADDEGYYYEYDGVCAMTYFWCPYQFLHEEVVDDETIYDSKDINTYTVIHEFAHVLGAYDYYDIDDSSNEGPLCDYDIMDYTFMDHNPFTKFTYKWINESRLVVTDSSITLDLTSFENTGDTILFGNNFDEALGVNQEYYLVCYYTNDKLNENNPLDSGVVVYHVDASLYEYEYYDETYYYIYNSNGSTSTYNNLIEFIKHDGEIVYKSGDSFDGTKIYDNNDDSIIYSFTVDSITDEKATITFTKN